MPFGLDREQIRNARLIISVGVQMGMARRDIRIGLMTAMQESSLRNLDYGDRDSLGLFQQRPSMGWGTPEQVTDPTYASRKFFNTLKTVGNRAGMSLSAAAQAVQRSAYPDAYAQWAKLGGQLMGEYGDNPGAPGTLGTVPGAGTYPTETLTDLIGGKLPGAEDPYGSETLGAQVNTALDTAYNPAVDSQDNPALAPPEFGQPDVMAGMKLPPLEKFEFDIYSGQGQGVGGGEVSGSGNKLVKFAKRFLGVPYVWGGDTPSGFDCSGLLQYIYRQFGIELPRISADQARAGKRISLKDMKPGDLVAWDNSSRNNGADHIAMYIGGGQVIHAPRPGTSVQISEIWDRHQAWGVRL